MTLPAPVTNTEFEVEFATLSRAFTIRRRRRGASAEPHLVVRDVSIAVQPGEVLGILGTSGCGKSTLLRITAGLEVPSSGTVRIDGTPGQGIDARCALAFQEPRLLPWRTVAGNVSLGLPQGTPKPAGAARVAELLELVGLTAFADHRPRACCSSMSLSVRSTPSPD